MSKISSAVAEVFMIADAKTIASTDAFIRAEYRKQAGRELVRLAKSKSAIIGTIFYSVSLDFGLGKQARDVAMECIPETFRKYAGDVWSGFVRAARDEKCGAAWAMTRISGLQTSHPSPKAAPKTEKAAPKAAPIASGRDALLAEIASLCGIVSDATLEKIRDTLIAATAPTHAAPLLLTLADAVAV